MNNYTWDLPEETRQIVEMMRSAGAQNNQPRQQDQPSSSDIVTDRTMQGVDANIAANAQQKQAAAQAQALQAAQAQQQQSQQPLLNPLSNDIYTKLIDAKLGYQGADAAVRAAAPQGTSEEALRAAIDAVRGGAHKTAENYRQLAKDLNVDTTGYGSDVSLEDAQRNLLTRQTKEVADILSGQGKYGISADQYFDQAYMRMIGEGASPSQAKRRAGREAQQYQAERVTYLRNAFNMYGRDGNYINDNGVTLLQEIARDMPQVASVYAQAYKMPTAAQDRANQLEDADILFNQGLKRADVAHGYDKDLAELQGSIQRTNDTHMGNITRENATHQNKLDMERDLAQAQNSFDNWRTQRKILIDDEQGAATRQANGYYNMVYSLVRQMGGTEEEAADFAGRKTLAYIDNFGVGKGGSKGGSKGGNKPTEPKYTEKQQDFLNVVENVFTRAYNDPTDTASIDRMEELINGEVEGQKAGDNFPVAMRQRWDDMINALRGMSYKIKADDDKATEYWSKVKDVNVLEELYPKENWDWYWERRGGKPK